MQTFSLNNKFGYLIKELRDSKKWSLRQASSESGLSAAYISMLERGQHSTTGKEIRVTPEAISKLAVAYDYPYNLLMIRAGYGEVDQDLSYGQEDPYDFDFIIHEETLNYDAYLDSLQNTENIPITINPPFNTNNRNETIGDRIIKLRDNKGLSRKELSDQLTKYVYSSHSFIFRFFSERDIEEIEEDETNPDSDFIIAISDFFKVSCDWLLRGKEYEFDENQLTKSQKILLENQKSADTMIKALEQLKQEIDGMNKKLLRINELEEDNDKTKGAK